MTGVCDEDVMVINNSRTTFELCGWNSGQHGERESLGHTPPFLIALSLIMYIYIYGFV